MKLLIIFLFFHRLQKSSISKLEVELITTVLLYLYNDEQGWGVIIISGNSLINCLYIELNLPFNPITTIFILELYFVNIFRNAITIFCVASIWDKVRSVVDLENIKHLLNLTNWLSDKCARSTNLWNLVPAELLLSFIHLGSLL